jgi:leader peptidase (prepilin peptidase)/N-methyltransferase
MYFYEQSRAGMPPFLSGGCFIYMLHLVLLASLIAASAIDLELWVIPLSICWFATAIGLIGASVGPCIINLHNIEQNFLLPLASAKTAALAAGGGVGLAFSLVLLKLGILKRSYEAGEPAPKGEPEKRPEEYNHRTEVLKEVVFLVPIILFACFWRALVVRSGGAALWWVDLSQQPVVAGLLGGLWAYFVGCGVVWATRIFGTLLFGKEAMGMGDVHLMGAAGAVLGPWPVGIAFFIAPFFGLLWAATQMFFKKVRQIPYGPFLSLGIFTVMIFHDRIVGYLAAMFYY